MGTGSPPMSDGCPCVPRPLRLFGALLDRSTKVSGQPASLPVDPLVELGGVGQEDSVEERSGVEIGRPRPFPPLERFGEPGDIAWEDARIQSQLVPDSKQDLSAERLVDPVDRVGQEVARPIRIGLGPQDGRDTFPTHPALSLSGQERQQGQPAPLDASPGHRALRPLDRRTAEQLEIQGLPSNDAETIRERHPGDADLRF